MKLPTKGKTVRRLHHDIGDKKVHTTQRRGVLMGLLRARRDADIMPWDGF